MATARQKLERVRKLGYDISIESLDENEGGNPRSAPFWRVFCGKPELDENDEPVLDEEGQPVYEAPIDIYTRKLSSGLGELFDRVQSLEGKEQAWLG